MISPDDDLHRSPHHDPLMPLFLRVLRTKGALTFMLADLGPDRHGLVELDRGVVVLDTSNTDGEHRATIAHELEHLDVDDAAETADAAAATRLVPLQEALIVQAGADPDLVATNLGVDRKLVLARVRSIMREADGGVG